MRHPHGAAVPNRGRYAMKAEAESKSGFKPQIWRDRHGFSCSASV